MGKVKLLNLLYQNIFWPLLKKKASWHWRHDLQGTGFQLGEQLFSAAFNSKLRSVVINHGSLPWDIFSSVSVEVIVQFQRLELPKLQTNLSVLVSVTFAAVEMDSTDAGVLVCWIITWANQAPELEAQQKICMFAVGKWSGLCFVD